MSHGRLRKRVWSQRLLIVLVVSLAILMGLAIVFLPIAIVSFLFGGVVLLAFAVARPRQMVLEVLPLGVFIPPVFYLSVAELPPITPIRGLLLAAIVASFRIRSDRVVIPKTFQISFTVFACYIALLFLISPTTAALSRVFTYTVEIFLPIWLVARAVRRRDDVLKMVTLLIVGAVLAAALMLFEFATSTPTFPADQITFFSSGPRGGLFRAQGVFAHQIIAGVVMMMILPLIIAFALRPDRIALLAKSCGPLLAAALIVSFSRGPWLGFAVACLSMVTVLRAENSARLLTIAFACLVVLLVSPWGSDIRDLTLALRDPVAYRDMGGIEVTYRSQLFHSTLEFMMSNPMGAGLGNAHKGALNLAGSIGSTSINFARSIDNGWARVLLELGWIGFGLFVIVLTSALVISLRSAIRFRVDVAYGPLAAALFATQVGFAFVSATVATFATWSQTDLLFGLWVGMAFAIGADSDRENDADVANRSNRRDGCKSLNDVAGIVEP